MTGSLLSCGPHICGLCLLLFRKLGARAGAPALLAGEVGPLDFPRKQAEGLRPGCTPFVQYSDHSPEIGLGTGQPLSGVCGGNGNGSQESRVPGAGHLLVFFGTLLVPQDLCLLVAP